MGSWTTTVGLAACLMVTAGCAEHDCADRCGEAQDEGCLWVEGDCLAFCDALEPVAARADCVAEGDAYVQCIVDAEACDIAGSCAAAATAYVDCVRDYCGGAPTDAECMTLDEAW